MQKKEAFWQLKRSFLFQNDKFTTACEEGSRKFKDKALFARYQEEKFQEFSTAFFADCEVKLRKVQKEAKETTFSDLLQAEGAKPKEHDLRCAERWFRNKGNLEKLPELVFTISIFFDIFDTGI